MADESKDQQGTPGQSGEPQAGPAAGGGGGAAQPSEEEVRAQLEEEIRNVRIEDVLLQSVVSLLNLSARRIAKEDERDLAQAKLGIDAASAVLELIPEQARPQVQQAISELQMLYAKQVGGGEEGGGDGGGSAPDGGSEPGAGGGGGEPDGGAEPGAGGEKPSGGDSKLWTPHQR